MRTACFHAAKLVYSVCAAETPETKLGWLRSLFPDSILGFLSAGEGLWMIFVCAGIYSAFSPWLRRALPERSLHPAGPQTLAHGREERRTVPGLPPALLPSVRENRTPQRGETGLSGLSRGNSGHETRLAAGFISRPSTGSYFHYLAGLALHNSHSTARTALCSPRYELERPKAASGQRRSTSASRAFYVKLTPSRPTSGWLVRSA